MKYIPLLIWAAVVTLVAIAAEEAIAARRHWRYVLRPRIARALRRVSAKVRRSSRFDGTFLC